MSKKLSYVALDKVETLRLTCRAITCNGSAEVSLTRIAESGRQVLCPECGTVLRPQVSQGDKDGFTNLADAVKELRKFVLMEHLGVEMVFAQ